MKPSNSHPSTWTRMLKPTSLTQVQRHKSSNTLQLRMKQGGCCSQTQSSRSIFFLGSSLASLVLRALPSSCGSWDMTWWGKSQKVLLKVCKQITRQIRRWGLMEQFHMAMTDMAKRRRTVVSVEPRVLFPIWMRTGSLTSRTGSLPWRTDRGIPLTFGESDHCETSSMCSSY